MSSTSKKAEQLTRISTKNNKGLGLFKCLSGASLSERSEKRKSEGASEVGVERSATSRSQPERIINKNGTFVFWEWFV
jgi:hypothetical protein